MKTGVIVQARMSSERLPGKVLLSLAGKPVLQYVLERLKRCEALSEIVVATSREASDDPIADFCEELGVSCYRGSLDDVAGRFVDVLKRHNWEAFVHVCGDSPLLDQRLIDQGITIFGEGDYDLVTNVWPRSYPCGQSVEVLKVDVFQKTYKQMVELGDKEHITKFFYQREQEFKIKNFTSKVNYTGVHMAVDTKNDFEAIEALIKRMDRPHWEYTVDEMVGMMEPAYL